MVDKNSAPAYSILGPKNTSLIKQNGMPGPGAYQTVTYIKTNTAQDSLPKGKRFSQYTTLAPGPGTYDGNKASHVPTALVMSRTKLGKEQSVPGPGSYNPDFHKITKSNSSYKIGGSQKLADQSKAIRYIPGPGQYDTAKSTLMGSQHAATFGPDRKIQLGYDPKTPGPGQYNQTSYYKGGEINQPNVLFSKSSRSQSMNTLAPGPGAYILKGELEDSVHRAKGFKIGEKVHTKQGPQNVPGPGAYNTIATNLQKKSMPSFSIGKQPKMKIENFKQVSSKPGPMKYDIKVSAFQHKSFVIPKQKRKGLGNQSNVPGPGAYNYKILSNTQIFSVPKSERKSLADAKQTPGPFQYNPDHNILYNSQYKGVGMGVDQRSNLGGKTAGPGPGNYNYDQKLGSGGFKIGKQKRSHEKDVKNPGPGYYDIPSTISNLPPYASSGKR